MNASRFLVVVALGGDAPDLSTLGVFLATGPQAISYRYVDGRVLALIL
jgi:ureidoglycolate lyase